MKLFTIRNKTYLAVIFVMAFVTVCFAATYTTSGSGGNWANTGTWSGGVVPSSWGNHTVNISQNVLLTSSTTQLNGFTAINLNAGRSFTSGSVGTPNNLSMQQVAFNVVNGNIIVYGNLTLNGTDLTITTGSLTVTGTLTLTNGATLVTNSANAISVAALMVDNTSTFSLNNGSLSVTNLMNIQSGTVTIAAGKTVTAGGLTLGNSSNAILNNNGSITVNGNVSQSGVINNNSTGTIQVNGTHTMVNTGSASFTNTGRLNVTGDLIIPGSAKFRVNPDGETYIDGNVTVTANENLIIGTSVNPPPYADMVIRQDLISTGSGDILLNKNGRLAVFGDVDVNGGGSFLTINSGGQMYVDGDMNFVGGGNHIVNNNVSSPYGLYTDGTVSYNGGGGSGTTGHPQGTVLDMYNEDLPFYNWVSGIPGGPLPIVLLYFKIDKIDDHGIVLKWVTTFENNFAYFEIERAGSDLDFKPIGRLEGYGGLDINTPYDYSDAAPLSGKNYYRLKSVDHDGSFEYSPVVLGNWSFSKGFSVYPNPIVNYKFTIELNDRVDLPTQIQLLDGAGNLILTEQLDENSTEVQLSENVKPGLYILKFFSGTLQKNIKVVIP